MKGKNKYKFEIVDDYAKGVLPDGTPFLIDQDMVEEVSKYSIHLNWKGYPYCVKNTNRKYSLMLHWIVLGFSKPPKMEVDHINRIKTDCRKSNLRLVTNQQNCMNRGLGKRNKTGYLGTFYNKYRRYYVAKICINNQQIYLLSSNDLKECAQAYNYAAKLLFRDFAGHKNPVDEASDEIKQVVYEKCKPYLSESLIATRKFFNS